MKPKHLLALVLLSACSNATEPSSDLRPEFRKMDEGSGGGGAGGGVCTIAGGMNSEECGWKQTILGLTGIATLFCPRAGAAACLAGAGAFGDRWHDWRETPEWWGQPWVDGNHSPWDVNSGGPHVPLGGW